MIKIDENAVSSFNWTPTVLGLQKTAMSYMDKLLGSSRILQPSVSVLEKGDMGDWAWTYEQEDKQNDAR